VGELWLQLILFTGYLTQNAFPKPLSEEQENAYVERMLGGDEEARNLLISHNLRLVAHIAKKFDVQEDESEDLISIGTIGLIKGINTFKAEKGVKLATYAARCAENTTLSPMRYLRNIEVTKYRKREQEVMLMTKKVERNILGNKKKNKSSQRFILLFPILLVRESN